MSALAVIPTYMTEPDDLKALEDCLSSLRKTEPDVEVLVVDDGSPVPGLVAELEGVTARFKSDLLRKPENEGFSKTVNQGLRRAVARGQDAVLVNADIEFIDEGWLERMQAQPRQHGEGKAWVVGALLLYPSGLIQHAGIFFSMLHREFSERFKYAPKDLPEALVAARLPVTGALQFISNESLLKVGIYDEGFKLGWEDVDYCIRVFQAGGECVYQPKVRAWHFESMFRGRPSPKVDEWQTASWAHFMEKYARTSFAEWIPSLI